MSLFILFSRFLVILYTLQIFVYAVKEISLNESLRYIVKRGETAHFCVTTVNSNILSSLYEDINIYAVIYQNKYEFEWHSVRGKSSDDFHTNVASLITRYREGDTIDSSLADVDLASSFFRDVVSACPSPIFPHHDKNICKIAFSTNARSCISVTSESQDLPITVIAKKERNYFHLLFLFLGFVLLMTASYFSGNLLFQYLLGISFFVTFAFVLIALFILHRTDSKITKNILGIVGMFAIYTAALFWFVRSNIRGLVLDYWELSVFYAVAMLLLSIPVIKHVLTREKPRHVFRVGIKWMIRILGLVLLYNASSSPMVSQLIMIACLILYFVFSLAKVTKQKPVKAKKYRE